MNVYEYERKVLEVGCQLLIPTSKRIICLNTEENSTVMLFVPDVRTIVKFLNDWLEMNDL